MRVGPQVVSIRTPIGAVAKCGAVDERRSKIHLKHTPHNDGHMEDMLTLRGITISSNLHCEQCNTHKFVIVTRSNVIP